MKSSKNRNESAASNSYQSIHGFKNIAIKSILFQFRNRLKQDKDEHANYLQVKGDDEVFFIPDLR